MDEYEYERLTIINNDGLLGAARGFMWFSGFMYLILGCLLGYNFGSTGLPDGPEWLSVLLGFCIFAVFAFLSMVNFIVVNSLANGSKWAWYAGMVLAVLYLPSCCFPFGALMIVGFARAPVRRAYGI